MGKKEDSFDGIKMGLAGIIEMKYGKKRETTGWINPLPSLHSIKSHHRSVRAEVGHKEGSKVLF